MRTKVSPSAKERSEKESTPTASTGCRRRRVTAPHSRNGCITCKIRHVKCDEQKPFCKKCPKAGWTCDGYALPPTKPKRPAPKDLIPKPKQVLAPSTAIPSLPSQHNRFQDQQEYQYFTSFCEYTTIRLANLFESSLWRVIVLQACDTEPAIRRAATAIGALTFECNPIADSQGELLRREFAYREYSKAIGQMHNSAREGNRTSLIACILFATFELFNNYPETAATQIHAGIRMINEWCPRDGKRKIDLEPITVEEEIVEAFSRLEAHATAFGDARGPRSTRGQGDIALFFTALQEAKTGLESIIQESMHWVSLLHPASKADDPPPQMELAIDPSLLPSRSSTPQNHGLRASHAALIVSFQQWETTFTHVWDTAHQCDALQPFLGSVVLRLQYLSNYLGHLTLGINEGSYYAPFTVELADILAASKSILGRTTIWRQSPSISSHTGSPSFMNGSGRNSSLGEPMSHSRNDNMWNGELENSWWEGGEGDRVSDEIYMPENELEVGGKWQSRTGLPLLQPFEEFPEDWFRRDMPAVPWN